MEIESVNKGEKVLGISRPEKGFDNASHPKTFDISYEKNQKKIYTRTQEASKRLQ